MPRTYWFTIFSSFTLGVIFTLLWLKKIKTSPYLWIGILLLIFFLFLNEKYSVFENLLRKIF